MSSSEQPILTGFFSNVCLQIRLALVLLVFAAFIYSSRAYSEDPFLRGEFEVNDSATDSIEFPAEDDLENNHASKPTPKAPNAIFPGYGAYRDLLTIYCKRIIVDGHYSRIHEILDKLIKVKVECRPCRQFYKALSCKVPTKQSAPAKPAVSLPSTELLAVLSEFFIKIAANPKLASASAEALSPLLAELSTPKDPISDAYFDIFIAYARAPLSKELEGAEKNQEKLQNKHKKKQLEALF